MRFTFEQIMFTVSEHDYDVETMLEFFTKEYDLSYIKNEEDATPENIADGILSSAENWFSEFADYIGLNEPCLMDSIRDGLTYADDLGVQIREVLEDKLIDYLRENWKKWK